GQWGWLPYDMAPTETLAFVCEVLIRDTYGVLSNYRGIEYGLPSNIERRFVPLSSLTGKLIINAPPC
ncbi:unnamed protein product, partial [Didymodactylos carnosus]